MEILSAVKGSDKEKRLASQFIAKFFRSFPNLAEQAIEAQFDLCEDDDVAVSMISRGIYVFKSCKCIKIKQSALCY